MHRLLVHGVRLALVLPFFAAGCASAAEGTALRDDGPLGQSAAAITAADAISRAEEWVTAKLLYCQSPNGADDSIDPSCSPICMRTSNPEWDPYRSDCSGLVSWAWGLPAPGRTTAEFAPNQTDITSVIDASTLQMGDAVNTDDSVSSEHHIMLFKAWTTPGQEATFIEEPGCSATPDYAHEFTSTVSISGTSITVDYNGITFQAIRYAALGASGTGGSTGSSGGPPTCQVNGVNGTCIDTSVCATMPGYVSTPGYCPGPVSEQCCTPTGNGAGGSASGTGGAPGAGGAPGSGASTGNGTSTSTGTGNGAPTGATGTSSGAGTGGGPAAHPDSPGATSGCQASAGQGAPSAAGLAAMAGLLLLTRRRRGLPRSR